MSFTPNQKSGLCEVYFDVIGYPTDWQLPQSTEQHAYYAAKAIRNFDEAKYVAFPWATFVNGLKSGKLDLELLLIILGEIRRLLSNQDGPVYTVSENPYTADFIEIFKNAGITDIFWPHKRLGEDSVEGIRLWPFPLFPTQTPRFPDLSLRSTRYLVNFIGGYNRKTYLSDTRQHIFDLRRKADDLRIVQRAGWHFERLVFKEQMQGVEPDDEIIETEAAYKKQFLDGIMQSSFSLCPVGYGLSNARIYEALALGSIPVILTEELDLPGDRALWHAACVIREDSKSGLDSALKFARSASKKEIGEMRAAVDRLYRAVGPQSYRLHILNTLQHARSNES